MRTKERLAAVLGDAGLGTMQQKAAAGYYDDFESPLATPIVQLVTDLRMEGRDDLAARAMNGEWDSTREEGEAWFKSHRGRKVVADLMRRHGGGQVGQ